MENKIITREVHLRALSEENIKNRTAEFVISTESIDSYDTVFKLDGWELERYIKNPIVAYGHRTYSDNPDMIIGTSEVFVEGEALIGRVRFEDAEVNPTAETIWKKVQAGTLRMASVGANVKEWRYGEAEKGENPGVIYFTRTELYEWSIVPLGSNPDALKRSEQTIEEIRSEMIKKLPVNNAENVSFAARNIREKEFLLNK